MSYLWPDGHTDIPTVTSEFNPWRKNPVTGRYRPHNGIDLIGFAWNRAAEAGTVTLARYYGGYGNLVIIKHDNGDETRYGHNAYLRVRAGQRVSRGQVVGRQGTTGNSTGVHCHFETRRNGVLMNPRTFMARYGASASTAGSQTSGTKETKVKTYHKQDATARKSGRNLSPGERFYLHLDTGKPQSNASNVVGNPGQYSITTHVYGEGTPGDIVELVLLWQDTEAKNPGSTNSEHYKERLTVDRDGYIRASREFKRGVSHGWAVYARLTAAHKNKDTVKVTVFDSDAYLFIDA